MALFEKLDMGWESIAVNRRRTSSSVSTYGGWWRTRAWAAAAGVQASQPAARACPASWRSASSLRRMVETRR